MTNKRRAVPGVHPYDGPAGGWGALKATAIAVRTQMDAFEALCLAASLGGDTDTIAAMLGAMLGACLGMQCWPEALI